MSVRDSAAVEIVKLIGKGARSAGSAGGGSILLTTEQHALDGAEHTGLLSLNQLDAVIGSPSSPTTVVDDAYEAFPTLTHLDEDHVLKVYRGGTDHATSLDGNWYYLIGTLDSDGTISWGSEQTLWNHVSLDLRDPSAMTTADGRILVSGCTADGTSISDSFVGYVIECTWDGTTLTVGTPTAIGSSLAGVREVPMRIVELPDAPTAHRFMVPINGLTSGTKDKVIVAFSADGVTGWTDEVTVASSASFFYTEPVAVRHDDGSLLMLIKENDARDILSTRSYDFGLTWTDLVNEFEGWGKPMFRQVRSGADLLVYREDDTTTTGRALYRLSYDRGATWTDAAALGVAAMQYADILPLGSPSKYGGGSAILVACSTENSSSDADIVTVTFTDIEDVRLGISGTSGASSGAGAEALDDLTDAQTSGQVGGAILAFDGTIWRPAYAPEPLLLEDDSLAVLENGHVAMSEPDYL